MAPGGYGLTAVATDDKGATTPSAPVAILVNAPPTVAITAPAANASFNAPATLTISADAADTDGAVTQVDFYQGTTLIGTATAAPYSISWANVAAGSYRLTAVASDDRGATTTSAPVAITVNALPTVSITSPASGATFNAPATITVSANATDADGTVAKVDFYQGTTLIGTATAAPYSITWSNVAAGSYTLTAVATDNSGATTTSAPVTITVKVVSTLYFIQVDQLGTPRLIADQNQNTVWRWDNQEPFGNDSPNQDPGNTGTSFDFPLRFPGQYYDRETNLAYNYFRDYDPATGRYVESDPIGLRGGINTYVYGLNSPTRYTDSLGLEVQLCRRPADLPWPLNNADHYWLKTDTQESGMGPANGGVPAQGNSDLPLVTRVQTNDHSGESSKPNAECKPVTNVDEQCVNKRIKPGQPLGLFHPGNNCQTFVIDVIDECRTVPPPECAANPTCAEQWKKYKRP